MNSLLQSKGNKPRAGKVFNCGYCLKLFYLKPSLANRNSDRKKFCSILCSGLNLKTNRVLNCVICKKQFYCSKSQQQFRARKNCSMECRNEYLSLKRSGENSHWWRGGISSQNRRIRYSAKMKKWRRAVFERDNYTCQFCGQYGGYLQADHIKPFAYFPNLRFELINGRTLCKPCHKTTDTYGEKAKKLYANRNNVRSSINTSRLSVKSQNENVYQRS